jgi:hypothetical protein
MAPELCSFCSGLLGRLFDPSAYSDVCIYPYGDDPDTKEPRAREEVHRRLLESVDVSSSDPCDFCNLVLFEPRLSQRRPVKLERTDLQIKCYTQFMFPESGGMAVAELHFRDAPNHIRLLVDPCKFPNTGRCVPESVDIPTTKLYFSQEIFCPRRHCW